MLKAREAPQLPAGTSRRRIGMEHAKNVTIQLGLAGLVALSNPPDFEFPVVVVGFGGALHSRRLHLLPTSPLPSQPHASKHASHAPAAISIVPCCHPTVGLVLPIYLSRQPSTRPTLPLPHSYIHIPGPSVPPRHLYRPSCTKPRRIVAILVALPSTLTAESLRPSGCVAGIIRPRFAKRQHPAHSLATTNNRRLCRQTCHNN